MCANRSRGTIYHLLSCKRVPRHHVCHHLTRASFWGSVNMLPFWGSVNQARKSQDFSGKPFESESILLWIKNYNPTSCCTNNRCVLYFLARTRYSLCSIKEPKAKKYADHRKDLSPCVINIISMSVIWMQRMSLWKVPKKSCSSKKGAH